MVTYPNAKINLGLYVTERRHDGYHNINTVFLPIGLCDRLEITPLSDNQIRFRSNGLTIDCADEDNLVVRACRLMQEQTGCGGADISLYKHIPFGAGLGGGSSDAAHTIIMLNAIYHLSLSNDDMAELVRRLGADCPFFIYNSPCYGEGIGDLLTPVCLPGIKGYTLLLAKSDVYVSTKEAYSNITPRMPETDIRDIVAMPVTEWRETLVNDFESGVFAAHPEIENLKELLYNKGAVYAAMSGSGASVFSLFADKEQAEIAAKQLPDNIFTYAQLLS